MKWLIWILQGFIIYSLLPAGLQKLSGSQAIIDSFEQYYGYGEGMVYLAGAMETAAAILLIIAFWKKPFGLIGSTIAAIVMFGAVLSQVKAGAPAGFPLLLAVLAAVIFAGTLKQMNKRI